jgi:catechol 2,3-dioxygenase-like lactoylglutathione lyase family enzyme
VKIERFDHLVRTVHDIDRTCDFYTRVLGMKAIAFQEGRTALQFGQQKLNLHAVRKEFEPKARNPTPGSANLCLITEISLDEVIQHMKDCAVEILDSSCEANWGYRRDSIDLPTRSRR